MAAYKVRQVFGEHFSYPTVKQCIEVRELFYVCRLKMPRQAVVDGFDYDRKVFHAGLYVNDTCVASVRGSMLGMAKGRCRLEWLAMTDGCRGVNAAHALIGAFEQVMRQLGLEFVRAEVPLNQTQPYFHCGFIDDGAMFLKYGGAYTVLEKRVTSA